MLTIFSSLCLLLFMVFCSPGFGARTTFYNRPTFREQATVTHSEAAILETAMRAAITRLIGW
jgi:hypothetical protein